MRVGIIGLGDIAQKAYLPVITAKVGVEPVLCTRNPSVLSSISGKYRIPSCVQSVDELIKLGVDAAFVHTATEAHVETAEKLLKANIHVYVDKPAAYSYEEALRLAELAEKTGNILMVGFNRRFAPMYSRLKEQGSPDIVVMQKNRLNQPDTARTFIFDDFIHVVDTLRYLAPSSIEDIQVKHLKKSSYLYNVTLQLSGKGFNFMGIMNRDSGITEEILEFMCSENKWVIKDMNQTTQFEKGIEKAIRFNDWDPILHRRGFYQIVDHFLCSVEQNRKPSPSIQDSLITHEICEKIVKSIEKL